MQQRLAPAQQQQQQQQHEFAEQAQIVAGLAAVGRRGANFILDKSFMPGGRPLQLIRSLV